jgi:uncharacterized membrane protein YbhN (UPF0104 family)
VSLGVEGSDNGTSGGAGTATVRQWWIRITLSLVVGAAFLGGLWGRLDLIPNDLSLPLWIFPAYLAVLLLYLFLRAGRWHILLTPLGNVPFTVSLRCGMAGIMWIVVLPFRLGEFARPLFIAQNSDIGVTQAFGTIAIERVLDGLVVCGLFFLSIALLPAPPPGPQTETLAWLRLAGAGVSGTLLTALLVLIGMALSPAGFGRIATRPVSWVLPSLAAKLEGIAAGIAEGMAALPSVGRMLMFLAITLLYWGVNIVSMWVLANGCGVPIGLAGAAALMSILGITLLVPAAPGMVGNFQAGLVLGMSMLRPVGAHQGGVDRFVFYLWISQLGLAVLLGLLSQWSLRLDWRRALGLAPRSQIGAAPLDGH